MRVTKRQLRRIIKETQSHDLNEIFGFGGPSKEVLELIQHNVLPELGKWIPNLVGNIEFGDYDRKDGPDMLRTFKRDYVDKALNALTHEDIAATIKKGKKPGKKLEKLGKNLTSFGEALEQAADDLKKRPGDAAAATKEAFGWVEEYFPAGLSKDAKIVDAKTLFKEGRSRARVSKRQLRKIIREEADIIINYANADELEPREDSWSGGENLTLPLDHSKVAKSYAVTAEPEMLAPAEPVLHSEDVRRIRVYRSKNDLGRSCVLPPIVYERYYDAYVSGNTGKALGILEEHLDKRIPGWFDYEW